MNAIAHTGPVPKDCIIFDTESTGLDPIEHRIIEIGAVRFRDGRPTDEVFHTLINPGRPIDAEAIAVHGITNAMVADAAPFADVADGFLAFIGDLPLVAHNAGFDSRFIAREMERLGRPALPAERYVDTLEIARRRFPGAAATLDALCRRMKISLARRTKHSALIDAELLAEVCVELNGGRQLSMLGGLVVQADQNQGAVAPLPVAPGGRRVLRASADERMAHEAFIAELGDNALWKKLDAAA